MAKLSREEFFREIQSCALARFDGVTFRDFLEKRRASGVDIPADQITIDAVKGFIQSAASGITGGPTLPNEAFEPAWNAYQSSSAS